MICLKSSDNTDIVCKSIRSLTVAALFWVGFSTSARADQVIVNGVNHTNAKITGLDQGKLQFRLADGRTVSAWIDEVQLILVDRGGIFDDFNQAEQFLHDGDAPKAIARYERTLRLSQEFWPDLIACRLLAAHDRAGQIDRAAQYFIRVVTGEFSGLAPAARLYPRTIPEKRDGRVARAVDMLAEESRKIGQDDRRVLLDDLRYEILGKTDPNAAKPLARNVAELAVPAPARTERVYGVVLRAMQEVFSGTPGTLSLGTLDQAIRDCPESSLPGFLLIKGQLLLQSARTREEIMHAAWAFLRVPIHMPNDELAPKALLEAARALYKLEKEEQARTLLVECYNHPKATPEIRKQAESGNFLQSLP
jgi:tetratricopeptide (TPR) repeat protein